MSDIVLSLVIAKFETAGKRFRYVSWWQVRSQDFSWGDEYLKNLDQIINIGMISRASGEDTKL